LLDWQQIQGLLANRRKAREARNWALSDELRNALDELGAFVFDHKDGSQSIHMHDKSFFIHMEKAGKLNNVKFKNERHYVEWRLQQDILAEKRFDAWLYSIQQSEAYKRLAYKADEIARTDT
jgi:hypothetical protein